MKTKKNAQFIPFSHEELEIKNALIQKARELKENNQLESQLTSAMIYASITEYLTGHFLENLRFFVYRSTYVDYAGIIYIDERSQIQGKTLGNMISLLEKYWFPDKSDVISTLKIINENRNNLFHNLAKTSSKDFSKLDESIHNIQNCTEEFLDKINVIYAGLQRVLIPTTNKKEEKSETSI